MNTSFKKKKMDEQPKKGDSIHLSLSVIKILSGSNLNNANTSKGHEEQLKTIKQ